LLVTSAAAQPASLSGRAHVLDGDTIEIAGARVRLHGIDAPELHQHCFSAGAETRCGETSRDALRQLAEGREAACEGRERDRYERLIAVCRVAGQDLGRAMVRAGQAIAFVRYSRIISTKKTRRAKLVEGCGPEDSSSPPIGAGRKTDERDSASAADAAYSDCGACPRRLPIDRPRAAPSSRDGPSHSMRAIQVQHRVRRSDGSAREQVHRRFQSAGLREIAVAPMRLIAFQ
jgi:hypothetical protein